MRCINSFRTIPIYCLISIHLNDCRTFFSHIKLISKQTMFSPRQHADRKMKMHMLSSSFILRGRYYFMCSFRHVMIILVRTHFGFPLNANHNDLFMCGRHKIEIVISLFVQKFSEFIFVLIFIWSFIINALCNPF